MLCILDIPHKLMSFVGGFFNRLSSFAAWETQELQSTENTY